MEANMLYVMRAKNILLNVYEKQIHFRFIKQRNVQLKINK